MNKRLIGSACALGCEVLYGLSYIFTKHVSESTSGFALLGWRFLVAFIAINLLVLFGIVKIRQLGEKLGFEKIIIKNGVMICFFISNPLSKYYKSERFSGILDSLNKNPKLFELKQNDNRLRIFSRNVDSIPKAYALLEKL